MNSLCKIAKIAIILLIAYFFIDFVIHIPIAIFQAGSNSYAQSYIFGLFGAGAVTFASLWVREKFYLRRGAAHEPD